MSSRRHLPVADLQIAIPFTQTPAFKRYAEAMGEIHFCSRFGSHLRIDQQRIASGTFCPISSPEKHVEDLQDILSRVLMAGRCNQIWLTEHPHNRLKIDEIKEAALEVSKDSFPWMIGAAYSKTATFLIDLKDERWTPNKKVRQNCRNFEKLGGTIEHVSTMDEMEDYISLYFEHRKALNLIPWPRGCFESMWEISQTSDQAFILQAKLDDEMIAAMGFLCGDGWVDEVHLARKQKLPLKCYPMEPLRMRAIEISRELGHRFYNLGGVDPDPKPGSKEEGIRRNKAKYRGQYEEFFRYYFKRG